MKNVFFCDYDIVATSWFRHISSEYKLYFFFLNQIKAKFHSAQLNLPRSQCVYDSVNSVCAHFCQHAKCICAYFQSAKSLKAFYLKPKCVCGHIFNPPKITFIAHLFQQATQCLYAFPSSYQSDCSSVLCAFLCAFLTYCAIWAEEWACVFLCTGLYPSLYDRRRQVLLAQDIDQRQAASRLLWIEVHAKKNRFNC